MHHHPPSRSQTRCGLLFDAYFLLGVTKNSPRAVCKISPLFLRFFFINNFFNTSNYVYRNNDDDYTPPPHTKTRTNGLEAQSPLFIFSFYLYYCTNDYFQIGRALLV